MSEDRKETLSILKANEILKRIVLSLNKIGVPARFLSIDGEKRLNGNSDIQIIKDEVSHDTC